MAVPIHRSRLPDPAGKFKTMERDDQDFLKELVGALQRELDLRIPFSTAQNEVLLFSPAGHVFALTVSDLGAVVLTPKSMAA
jgi:hypothetical protein